MRRRWGENLTLLTQWADSEQAFWVPRWAAEKFCREAAGTFGNIAPEEVGALLRELVEEGNKR